MKLNAPAGAIDRQAGTFSVRQLPPLIVVELTSAFDADRGYAWEERRFAPGTGIYTPDNPLSGDLAYDITSNEDLQPGTICAMSVERDQTTYVLWFAVGFAQAGGGSGSGGGGSGSGSGLGCGTPLAPVTIDCTSGRRTLTIKSFGISFNGNQLVPTECSSQDVTVGACSPNNPDGTVLAVAVKVCPQFTTLDYLDHASVPRTLDVVTGITVERRLVTVPIADETGCVEDQTDCCTESGSGSGADFELCTLACARCSTGMSGVWALDVVGMDEVLLYHVRNPDDGNHCRFGSLDLTWDLRLELSGVWVLTNLDDGRVWILLDEDWACLSDNVLDAVDDGEESALVFPVYDCSGPTSYNCVAGSCVRVSGTGGTYPTLAACQAACGAVTTPCCVDPIPATLHLTVVETMTCTCVNGTYPLAYDGGLGYWTSGVMALCGRGVEFRVACHPTLHTWSLTILVDGSSQTPLITSSSCGPPLALEWDAVNVNFNGLAPFSPACVSSANITATP